MLDVKRGVPVFGFKMQRWSLSVRQLTMRRCYRDGSSRNDGRNYKHYIWVTRHQL